MDIFDVPDFVVSFTEDPISFINNPESLPAGLQAKRNGDSIVVYWGERLLVDATLLRNYKIRRKLSFPYVVRKKVQGDNLGAYLKPK